MPRRNKNLKAGDAGYHSAQRRRQGRRESAECAVHLSVDRFNIGRWSGLGDGTGPGSPALESKSRGQSALVLVSDAAVRT